MKVYICRSKERGLFVSFLPVVGILYWSQPLPLSIALFWKDHPQYTFSKIAYLLRNIPNIAQMKGSWKNGYMAEPQGLDQEAKAFVSRIKGRCLLTHEAFKLHTFQHQRELLHIAYTRFKLGVMSGIKLEKRLIKIKCHRCLHIFSNALHCTQCENLGKVSWESVLLYHPCSMVFSSVKTISLSAFKLSPAQKNASLEALSFLRSKKKERFLLWAVTGAGKTEMIFPLIQYAMLQKWTILVCTPRKDVVLELQPRLKQAFPKEKIVTLYGGSSERFDDGSIFLATTHQLLRFKERFQLVIIDELDAFPYHNDPMLQNASRTACVKGGKTLYLSATPPRLKRFQFLIRYLPGVRVPVRYHRHPLPVPEHVMYTSTRFYEKLSTSLKRGAQVFIFVPRIALISPILETLRKKYPSLSIEGVSSKDPERADKVIRFRENKIKILVTTTILERGVTVACSDVFILYADAKLFDDTALIQMAGRAGRSIQDPKGRVYIFSKEMTKSIRRSIRTIKKMNTLAKKKGYLK